MGIRKEMKEAESEGNSLTGVNKNKHGPSYLHIVAANMTAVKVEECIEECKGIANLLHLNSTALIYRTSKCNHDLFF